MLKRLIFSILSLWIITVISFFAIELSPKDISLYASGSDLNMLTPAAVEKIRQNLELDKPVYSRYFKWLSKAIRLDFGNSMITGRNIGSEFGKRFIPTVIIATGSIILAFLLAIIFSISAILNNKVDGILRFLTTIIMSLPIFLVSLLLLITLMINLEFIPVFWEDSIYNYIMPISIIGFYNGLYLSRVLRNKLFDIIHSEYFLAALGKGNTFLEAIYRHALRNSLVTIITMLGMRLVNLMGGLILIESIFSIPGLGAYILESISLRDYPVIQCYILFIGGVIISVNLIMDIIIRFIDPRLIKESLT